MRRRQSTVLEPTHTSESQRQSFDSFVRLDGDGYVNTEQQHRLPNRRRDYAVDRPTLPTRLYPSDTANVATDDTEPPTATTATAPTATATDTATEAPTRRHVPPTATLRTDRYGSAERHAEHAPTATVTNTSTPVPPTATNTRQPVPPTATNTATITRTANGDEHRDYRCRRRRPTRRRTRLPPTATNTATNTPVPPTATNTATHTPVPPTATNTATNTPVPPTATNTATRSSPTATNTPTSSRRRRYADATPTADADSDRRRHCCRRRCCCRPGLPLPTAAGDARPRWLDDLHDADGDTLYAVARCGREFGRSAACCQLPRSEATTSAPGLTSTVPRRAVHPGCDGVPRSCQQGRRWRRKAVPRRACLIIAPALAKD